MVPPPPWGCAVTWSVPSIGPDPAPTDADVAHPGQWTRKSVGTSVQTARCYQLLAAEQLLPLTFADHQWGAGTGAWP